MQLNVQITGHRETPDFTAYTLRVQGEELGLGGWGGWGGEMREGQGWAAVGGASARVTFSSF